MRKVVLSDVRKIDYIDTDIPQVKPGWVLIKILRCGICGTDVHNYYKETIFGKDQYPFNMGHEICGIVDSVGENVENVKPGDKVVMNPFWTCSSCEPCYLGYNNNCDHLDTIGLHGPSGNSEYTLAPATSVVKVPDDADIDKLTFTEPLGTIIYGLDKIHLSPVHDVLIIGPGPIGLLFFQLLKNQPINSLTVAGRNDSKLEFARKLGATRIVNTAKEQDNMKYDVIIDCTGNAAVAESTVSLAKFGAQILIFGVCEIDSTITLHPFELYKKDISYNATFALNHNAFLRASHLILNGYVDVTPLIAGVYPVGKLEDCIHMIKDGKINGKIIIDTTKME